MKRIGWFGESYRHYLAAKGVSTGRRYNMATQFRLPQYQLAEIKAQLGEEAAREAREVAINEGLTARQLAERYGVRYVRKMKDAPEVNRAYVPGSVAVERLEEGPHGARGPLGPRMIPVRMGKEKFEIVPEDPFQAALFMRGKELYPDLKKELQDSENLWNNKILGTEDDLRRGRITYGSIELAKEQLAYARVRLAAVQKQIAELDSAAESGKYQSIVPVQERGAILEQMVLAPKRAAAIEDAVLVPVVPVALPPPKPKVPDKALQLRMTKFLAKKRFSLGERIVGVGMITQSKVFENREKKVYGRVFGNRR